MGLFDRIQNLCGKHKITQTELEKILGFGKGTISKWAGKTVPSADKLKKVADYFEVSMEFLMAGSEEKNINSSSPELKEYLEELRSRPEIMYEVFTRLLDERNLTPYRVSKDTGISQATLSDWKRGISTPKSDKLQTLAEYFGVSVQYLMTGKDDPSAPTETDEELMGYLKELKDRPEMRMLFSVSKNASKGEIEKTVRIIEALKEQSEGGI